MQKPEKIDIKYGNFGEPCIQTTRAWPDENILKNKDFLFTNVPQRRNDNQKPKT